MRRDSPLAEREHIRPEDLWDKPLIISEQRGDDTCLWRWLQRKEADLHIVATYNLLFNASLLVDEGLGYAPLFRQIGQHAGDRPLFPPLFPAA